MSDIANLYFPAYFLQILNSPVLIWMDGGGVASGHEFIPELNMLPLVSEFLIDTLFTVSQDPTIGNLMQEVNYKDMKKTKKSRQKNILGFNCLDK